MPCEGVRRAFAPWLGDFSTYYNSGGTGWCRGQVEKQGQGEQRKSLGAIRGRGLIRLENGGGVSQ